MTPLRLIAIAAIFFCTTLAWMVLGGTVVERTGESDGRLREEVEALWGREHRQTAPVMTVQRTSTVLTTTESVVDKTVTQTTKKTEATVELATTLQASTIDVGLDLQHRKKGLLWWPTYDVAFTGTYRFALPVPASSGGDVLAVDDDLQLEIPMSARGAVYDGFFVKLDGVVVPMQATTNNTFLVTLPRAGKSSVVVDVAYRSRGLGTWVYGLVGDGNDTAQLTKFDLALKSNVAAIDFPVGTLSPTTRVDSDAGAVVKWHFDSLVTGQSIGVELPAKLNPGPVAARISFFAPVSLLFFFTVMVIVGVVKQRSLHPMNYFFLAAAFFAFHLLFAYLVDVVELGTAFGVSSVVSLGLVISYLRIVQGAKVAVFQAGGAQLVFLVGFSLAFFHEGQTGLTVAIGSVVTLFVLMQLTARVKWSEVFGSDVIVGGAPVGVPGLEVPPRARD